MRESQSEFALSYSGFLLEYFGTYYSLPYGALHPTCKAYKLVRVWNSFS